MRKIPAKIAYVLALALPLSFAAAAGPAAAAAAVVPVRVMIVNMFVVESGPWLKALPATREIAVPGLTLADPVVRCTVDDVCQMTSGMGHANAAASLMALIYSDRFDLRHTYFLVAGIAGIDPASGTLGSAAWARYAVDIGLAHEIDAREMPHGWQTGYFGLLADAPGEKPRLEYGSEVFRPNEALLQQALALSAKASLADAQDVRAYRAHYPKAPANQPPTVVQCDTATSDLWWSGRALGMQAQRWTKLMTGGRGNYCTSQQEDNAILTALERGAQSGLLDRERIAVLRTGSDFDRPYPGQSVIDSMLRQREVTGAFSIAAENLVRAGLPLVTEIATHWDAWRDGVPSR
ncbi:MAG: purine nucleoside permease [Proteobacteria bacterium]|nr:purine nucleoside permease [Pseudomonadota bacterium]